MDQTTQLHAPDEHHEEHGGLGKYLVVFFFLAVLTLCSFMTVADFWPFDKTPTWIFMMGVSCTKAMLVILCFMHLWWEANWKYVLTIPAAMMSMFLLLMLVPDIGCRQTTYSEERIAHAAVAEETTDHADQHAAHDEEHESDHEDHDAAGTDDDAGH